VLKPGLLTTVQDLGRGGRQAEGVPEAGAVDPVALRIGNRLVGNPESAAGLEMTLVGARFQAGRPLVVAVTGAEMGPLVNGVPVAMWEAFALATDDVLSFAGLQSGCRTYLTVAGGIDTPVVLGSRSSDLFGHLGPAPLAAGDLVPVGAEALPAALLSDRRLPPELQPAYPPELTVRVVPGPQADRFKPEALAILSSAAYVISTRSDRMGVRLEGPVLPHWNGADIISDGMPLGGIQVPPDGKPIVLLANRQTMGGYTKIGVTVSADVGRIAQLPPGGRIRFELVTRDEAHLISAAAMADLELRLAYAGRGWVPLEVAQYRRRNEEGGA
jgi:biotin-dependent carboxylase-like uncharacterized protein